MAKYGVKIRAECFGADGCPVGDSTTLTGSDEFDSLADQGLQEYAFQLCRTVRTQGRAVGLSAAVHAFRVGYGGCPVVTLKTEYAYYEVGNAHAPLNWVQYGQPETFQMTKQRNRHFFVFVPFKKDAVPVEFESPFMAHADVLNAAILKLDWSALLGFDPDFSDFTTTGDYVFGWQGQRALHLLPVTMQRVVEGSCNESGYVGCIRHVRSERFS